MLTLAAVAIALRMIQNTYAGWNMAAYFCEELHAPERNVVREAERSLDGSASVSEAVAGAGLRA